MITPSELDELEQVKDVSPMEWLRQAAKVWNALPALIAAARRAIELESRLARAEEILGTLEDMQKWQDTPQMADALNALARLVIRRDREGDPNDR